MLPLQYLYMRRGVGVTAETVLVGTVSRLSPGRADVKLQPSVVFPVQNRADHVLGNKLSHRHCAAD